MIEKPPRVTIVGGPAKGSFLIERPKVATLYIPTSTGGMFVYTLRRCRNAAGELVEVLAPAGREVDPKWLSENGLTN